MRQIAGFVGALALTNDDLCCLVVQPEEFMGSHAKDVQGALLALDTAEEASFGAALVSFLLHPRLPPSFFEHGEVRSRETPHNAFLRASSRFGQWHPGRGEKGAKAADKLAARFGHWRAKLDGKPALSEVGELPQRFP